MPTTPVGSMSRLVSSLTSRVTAWPMLSPMVMAAPGRTQRSLSGRLWGRKPPRSFRTPAVKRCTNEMAPRRVVFEREVSAVLDAEPELLFQPALEELLAEGVAEGDADAATTGGRGAEQVDQVEVLLG